MNTSLHPINRDDYAIYTPSIARFTKQITVWLDNMVPGAFIYGKPRLGKTRSIRYWLEDLLDEHYEGEACLYKMNYKLFQNSTENNFLEELILAVMGKSTVVSKSRSKSVKYEFVANHIITQVMNKKSNRVLFIIDEAQNIPEIGYRWLCNFQNLLDEHGLRLTFVLVGSYEMAHQYSTFTQTGNTQIVGRFMLHSSKFHGVLSLEELTYIFEGYDEESEWPKGSKTSFTKFYFSNAFDNGFRLSTYSELFWNVYIEQFNGKDSDLEIPMEHVGKAVNYIFRNYGNDELSSFSLDKNIIEEAINHTQYANYMNSVF
ncbi:ATP-binding protein [Glaciecola sp. 2405UD65-10]|uniref:ATP-binding protein n=1 Tax=Glaciecola sp. 2405UD65-10 TaxID=3397244 RepID=UPI003B5AF4B7